jgi:hypothetical protein
VCTRRHYGVAIDKRSKAAKGKSVPIAGVNQLRFGAAKKTASRLGLSRHARDEVL